MPADRITLKNLVFYAYHGLFAAEKEPARDSRWTWIFTATSASVPEAMTSTQR